MSRVQTDSDPNFGSLRRAIRAFDGRELTAGIYAGEIATYAAANEFGTEHTPARPFFSSAMDNNGDKHLRIIGEQAGRVLGGETSADAALAALGVEVRNDIIRSIDEGPWEANAESTVRRKKSSRPLFDTGAMKRAVTFRVGRAGGAE
ncbi:MAG: HK97-gp10 family putative phage morphogenesis protein [Patescibacteria group bacterium]